MGGRQKLVVLAVSLALMAGSWSAVAPSQAAASSVSFAAVGDIGALAGTSDYMLRSIGRARPDFAVALGDLSYEQEPAADWCRRVKDQLNAGAGRPAGDAFGETYPFQLMLGNHDVPEAAAFSACLPDRLGVTAGPAGYPRQYTWDAPAAAPLVRFLALGTVTQDGYAPGSASLAWVARAIDEARARGIRWVVVAVHENYVSAGKNAAQVPASLMTLLLDKRVDLVLQGHDHNYQRSKQLATGADCPVVPTGTVQASCITGDGANGAYVAGRGTVVVITGTGGRGSYPVDPADPEAGYFAAMSDRVYGWTGITATPTSLTGRFVQTGGVAFTDSWTIGDGSPQPPQPPAPPPVALPPGTPQNLAVTQVRRGDGGTATTTLSWTPSSNGGPAARYQVTRNQKLLADVPAGPAGAPPAFDDTTAPVGTTLTYRVVAVDAAGRASGPSRSATVVVPAGGSGTVTFLPVADATVNGATPATPSGTSAELGASTAANGAGTKERSYLRFDVTGVGRTVSAARLELTTADPSDTGATVWTTQGTWDEQVTWATSPPATTWLGKLPGSAPGAVVGRDVSTVVTGDGSYSFLLSSSGTDRVSYLSRENAAGQPRLVLTLRSSDGAAPGDVGTPAATTPAAGQVDLSWAAATDDTGVAGYQVERDGVLVTTRADTRWSDYGRAAGRTSTYRVRALDAAGNAGAWSAPVAVTAA